MGVQPGLRERKSARMGEAIERAAFELALEQGYDHTTVAEIAERADVAPRTIFLRYLTKEGIISGPPTRRPRASWQPSAPTTDRCLTVSSATSAGGSRRSTQPIRIGLRNRAILGDPFLRRTLRGQLDAAEQIIAQHLATELDLPGTTPGVRVLAAGITGLFMAILETSARDPEHCDPVAITEAGLPVIRAGLDALKTGA